ncbi:hypothetical protein GCM10009603_31420 [Nocardiopsis exhalans]
MDVAKQLGGFLLGQVVITHPVPYRDPEGSKVQRVPLAPTVQFLDPVRTELSGMFLPDQANGLLCVEGAQLDPGRGAQPHGAREFDLQTELGLSGAAGQDEGEGDLGRATEEILQQRRGIGIGPVCVIDHDDRVAPGHPPEQ